MRLLMRAARSAFAVAVNLKSVIWESEPRSGRAKIVELVVLEALEVVGLVGRRDQM